jgi:hypothetical protein
LSQQCRSELVPSQPDRGTIAAAITFQGVVDAGKGLSMDPKVLALERAFHLAGSRQVAKIDELKKRLKLEGYDQHVVNGGPVLISQLKNRIKAARRRLQ